MAFPSYLQVVSFFNFPHLFFNWCFKSSVHFKNYAKNLEFNLNVILFIIIPILIFLYIFCECDHICQS